MSTDQSMIYDDLKTALAQFAVQLPAVASQYLVQVCGRWKIDEGHVGDLPQCTEAPTKHNGMFVGAKSVRNVEDLDRRGVVFLKLSEFVVLVEATRDFVDVLAATVFPEKGFADIWEGRDWRGST